MQFSDCKANTHDLIVKVYRLCGIQAIGSRLKFSNKRAVALTCFYRFAHGLCIIYAYARCMQRSDCKTQTLHMLFHAAAAACWFVCFFFLFAYTLNAHVFDRY